MNKEHARQNQTISLFTENRWLSEVAMKRGTILSLCCLLTLSVGCAGTNFVRPEEGSFVLGKTTPSEVIKVMGNPSEDSPYVQDDKTMREISYSFASMLEKPHIRDVVPSRSAGFWFYNDVMVGQCFISSFEIDHTDFDEGKVSQITKDKTTYEEMVALLGKPACEYIYPFNKHEALRGAGYLYTQYTQSHHKFMKTFIVEYSSDNVIRETAYSASGEK
jgi:hypothetical protein